MAYSTQRSVSDGTLQLLMIDIEFFDKSEITAYFNNIPTTAFVWATDKSIRFNVPVTAGVEVLLRRTTDLASPRHVFTDGAQFKASTLDEDFKQILHIAQEAIEGANVGDIYQTLNMHGNKITNVGVATATGDAVSLGQYQADADGAYQSRLAAAASAAAAEVARAAAVVARTGAETAKTASETARTASQASATASAASAASALAYRDQSLSYAQNSQTYSTNSYNSSVSSGNSANAAAASAATAAIEAAKLGNANEFMGSLQSVDTPSKLITWNTGWTLRANSMVVGDAAGITMTSSLLSRAGSMGVYSTSGNLGLAATTGSVDITANTGYVNAFTSALRVIAENSIIHFRSSAKMSALFSAPGNGSLNMVVYSATGDAPASFSFMSNGNVVVPGTVAAATLTASGTAAVTGAIYSRGRAVMIGATSAFVALTAAGSSPPGKCRMTHNLGVLPIGYQLEYRCITAEYGYAVEDRLFAADTNYQSSTTTARGGQLSPVSASVCDYYFGGTGVVILNKATGVAVTMTPSSWQVRVTAYGLSDG